MVVSQVVLNITEFWEVINLGLNVSNKKITFLEIRCQIH